MEFNCFITTSVYSGAFAQHAAFIGKAENWIAILSLNTILKSTYNLNQVKQINRNDSHQNFEWPVLQSSKQSLQQLSVCNK